MENKELNNKYDRILNLKEVRLQKENPNTDDSHKRLIDFRRFEERHYIEEPIYFCS